MDNYFIYLLISIVTIASPGPGVLYTITNSINLGFKNSLKGILGITLGMLILSVVASTSVGILFATSAYALLAIKLIGGIYLLYLAIKLLLSRNNSTEPDRALEKNNNGLFVKGVLISALNPKPMIFFVALFPQFISANESYFMQLALLSISFSVLVFIVHSLYSALFSLFQLKGKHLNIVNKISGVVFFIFAVALFYSFATEF
ncbi:LysE family translocator [Carnimonas bestiolae]|uniref:LysE family translocator n=1 Tax=Carnimonas bestiolae TaxID=3402172 RepID=UPI003EDC77C7